MLLSELLVRTVLLGPLPQTLPTTPDGWIGLLIGPVGLTMGLMLAIYGNVRGWWYSGAACTAMQAQLRAAADAQRDQLLAQAVQTRADSEAALAAMRADRDEAWAIVKRYLVAVEGSVSVAAQATTAAVTLAQSGKAPPP